MVTHGDLLRSIVAATCLASLVGCSSETPDSAGRAGSGAGSGGLSAGTAGGSGGNVITPSGGAGSPGGGAGGADASASGGGNAGGAAGVSSGSGGASAGSGGASAGGGGADEIVDTRAMVSALGVGTNIGNTLENTASWETGWSQPLITQAFINGLAGRGIKTVRVPVAWDTYASNGTIEPAKMARVQQVVSFIIEAGMYAIVNIHWDGGWIDNEKGAAPYSLTDEIKTKFVNYWKQIGTAFSGVGHKLILEGMNEEGRWTTDGQPYGPANIPPLNEMNALFVSTARAQGGFNATRALLIAGFNTDLEKTCVPAFTVPTDPAGAGKLFLSIHYYTPWTFTIKEANDADATQPVSTTWGTDAEKKTLEDLFTKLGTCSADKKVPIILGEFGVTLGTAPYVRESASRVAWMTAVAKACKSRGIVPVLWDTGAEISRTDGAFSTDFQQVFNAVK
jgi:endoglucanase